MIDWKKFGARERIEIKMGKVKTETGGTVMAPKPTKIRFFSPDLTDEEARILTEECGVVWSLNDPKLTGSEKKYRTIYNGQRYYSDWEAVVMEKPKPFVPNMEDVDEQCAATTLDGDRCARNSGFGEDGEYCKQHAQIRR